MIARCPRTSEKFTQVANLMLRGVLISKPEHVKPGEMRQALRRHAQCTPKRSVQQRPDSLSRIA